MQNICVRIHHHIQEKMRLYKSVGLLEFWHLETLWVIIHNFFTYSVKFRRQIIYVTYQSNTQHKTHIAQLKKFKTLLMYMNHMYFHEFHIWFHHVEPALRNDTSSVCYISSRATNYKITTEPIHMWWLYYV